MQILNAYSCLSLSKGRSADRKQKGFAREPGCRYTWIMTVWASPGVCDTFTAMLRVEEELKLERETAKVRSKM